MVVPSSEVDVAFVQVMVWLGHVYRRDSSQFIKDRLTPILS